MNGAKFSFRVTIETQNETGQVLEVYCRIRKGKVDRTVEYANGNVFADYNKRGELLGIEILAPCRAKVIDQIAIAGIERKFLRKAIPGGMLVSA